MRDTLQRLDLLVCQLDVIQSCTSSGTHLRPTSKRGAQHVNITLMVLSQLPLPWGRLGTELR